MLEGKVAIVTGASSGIGLAISEALAKERATVVMAARRLSLLKESAERFSQQYNTIVYAVKTDMMEKESRNYLLDYTIQKHGAPNILVNSAGVWGYEPLSKMTKEEHDMIFNMNYTTKLYFIKEVLKYMKEGVILNISSIAGSKAYDNQVAYCSSMAALNMATKSLDLELKDSIRTYALAPGLVDTKMSRKNFTELFNITEEQWNTALKPSDVADRAVEIINNAKDYDSKYNNGSVIVNMESKLKA